MQDDIAGLIAGIPVLAGWDGPAQRLGGLTNRVYRLGDAILRVPGEGTADYIDRAAEAVAAEAAARAGVSPKVLHIDPANGLMVTRYIAGTVTMTPDAFRDRPGAPERAAMALRQLHQSGQVFATRFELFAMIDDYLRLLSGKDVALPQGYHAVVADAEAVRAALARTPVPLVPCHCDPLCENFLDVGSRMWIVDWEYAGMNDPMWDLGDLSVEAEFDAAQDDAMLMAYFNGPAPDADRARMVIYKAMCDLLWTLWGLIQLANDNPAEDFQAYADGRFARCRALMASPVFSQHVAVLAGK
ncbi:MAG: choline/ethanolamine kinase family protein [Pseudotabrizicola sp.]|uniref:choline/ethanolamine kinase family protein n=1 Tax=Pseudotabrizicola sp. TaxID=2939647 RepID=UPI00271D208D|nr:choline/ethanolamine kinase family protein [Pseudotabrizicola sp.]MDO8884543.1 choline/ethanolamine kinase family protein [Pseudotabrizicola sp.]MDP2081276.1 choline/ethanolamine kinase family protein [Pseudotabrizicola sp.]MDZ7576105.1 choline/ethanolamine kinase family protein [Pseudotabrizicola sp.]